MNQQLENILNDLNYKNIIIESIDSGAQPLSDFKNWNFCTLYDYKAKPIKCITFESDCFWNEQIVDTFVPIRKKCIQKHGYDIIPLDYDMCAGFDLWNGKVNNEPLNQFWINKIHHVCRKSGIEVKYLMRGYGDNDGIIFWINKDIYKLSRKEQYSLKYLSKYFDKKYKIGIEAFTYYEVVKHKTYK